MQIKKTLIALALFSYQLAVNAQDLTSKNGEAILPQAKDLSIGLDATKFIKNASWDYMSTAQTIIGKYFIDAKTAYRAGVRIGVNNWTSKAFVDDRAAVQSSVVAYPSVRASKENKWQKFTNTVGLSFGMEKRRGSTRLQGVYGAEAGFYFSSSRDIFTYGNKLNPLSTSAPVTVDPTGDAMSSPVFGKAANIDTVPRIQGVIGAARATDRKNGVSFSVGARAFIGAEYFVLPKLSIGGEFGWGFAFSMSGRSKTTWESTGQSQNTGSTSTQTVKKTTIDGSQSSSFKMDNDNSSVIGGASASLRLLLYF
jgi:hypothetical protein